MYPESNPKTMPNWFSAPRAPRSLMGAISDKYTGATAVLTPKHNRNIEDFKLTTFTGIA